MKVQVLEGAQHSDIKVEVNGFVIPNEFFSIEDGNVILNQRGKQFVKTESKKIKYGNNKRIS